MKPQCVFFASDDPCVCRLLAASASGVLPDGIGAQLAERYCGGGRFIMCPIFRRFERSLSRANDQLESLRPAYDPEYATDTVSSCRRRRRSRDCA